MKELMKAQWEAARKKAQMQESVANVSEAALSYAKVKADSGESATLNGLLDRYPGVNFSTNTQAFSQKGTNNIQITPIILA